MTPTHEARERLAKVAADLNKYTADYADALTWGGPTIYPTHPIDEKRARSLAADILAALSETVAAVAAGVEGLKGLPLREGEAANMVLWLDPEYAPNKPEVIVTRDLVRRLVTALLAADAETEEAAKIGERDGYEQAVQDIDILTGGDGEYRFCTNGDPERHTPNPEAMKARIAARFAALTVPAPSLGDREGALNRWVAARKVILTMGAADAGFKAAWQELGEAEWALAALSVPSPSGGDKEVVEALKPFAATATALGDSKDSAIWAGQKPAPPLTFGDFRRAAQVYARLTDKESAPTCRLPESLPGQECRCLHKGDPQEGCVHFKMDPAP